MNRRCISNIIGILLVIGITIATGILVSSILMRQIRATSGKPTHIQIDDISMEKLTEYCFRISITLSNPTSKTLTIAPQSVNIYISGFTITKSLTIKDTTPIRIAPGETGKIEIVASGSPYDQFSTGIIGITLYITDGKTGYNELILIPLQ